MNNSFTGEMDKYRTIADLGESVTRQINKSFGTKSSLFFLYDQEANILKIVAESEGNQPGTDSGDSDAFTFTVDSFSFPGWCALHNEALFSNNPKDEAEITAIFCRREADNAAVVPVREYGKCIGVILMMDKPGGFTNEGLEEIQQIADELHPVLSYINMREELEDLEVHFADMISRMVDSCTIEGSGHTHRVAALCSELSAIMDIPERTRRKLWKGAIFHDVGKILLQGRQPWEITRFHSREGASYLRSIRVLMDVAHIVETSHERFDGSGFPSGLAGDVVPIEAWILAFAEDLEEFSHNNKTGFFEDMLRQFFVNNCESHHPSVVEALSVLANTDSLENILRGWK